MAQNMCFLFSHISSYFALSREKLTHRKSWASLENYNRSLVLLFNFLIVFPTNVWFFWMELCQRSKRYWNSSRIWVGILTGILLEKAADWYDAYFRKISKSYLLLLWFLLLWWGWLGRLLLLSLLRSNCRYQGRTVYPQNDCYACYVFLKAKPVC